MFYLILIVNIFFSRIYLSGCFAYTDGSKEKNRFTFHPGKELKWEFTVKVDYTLSSCRGKLIG